LDYRAIIVVACWIAIAIISSVIFWVGGVNLWNNISVGLLVFTALIITFGLSFGLKPEKKPEIPLLSELQSINAKIDELKKEVENIKKIIEE